MLTTTAQCALSHEQVKLLSERSYRYWHPKPPLLSVRGYAEELGMNRRTVRKAIRDLGDLWCDEPIKLRPDWFAEPQDDGTPRIYRYYMLRPDSDLTELDNRVLMMLWSLAKSPGVPITRRRLAKAVRASRDRVSQSLRKLQKLKLVAVAVSGQTIFIKLPESFDRWQDEKYKRERKKPKEAQADDFVLTEDWLRDLVDHYYPGEDAEDIAHVINQAIPDVKKVPWAMREIADYWQTVLRIGVKPMEVFMYARCHEVHLHEALATHREKGKVRETCSINLLTCIAKQHLKLPPLPWERK
jgi:DNA-binding transcriptional regulator YhcF (GntR family)